MQNFTDAQVNVKTIAKKVYCRWPLQLYVPKGNDNVNSNKELRAKEPFWINHDDGAWQWIWCFLGNKGCIRQSNGADFSSFYGQKRSIDTSKSYNTMPGISVPGAPTDQLAAGKRNSRDVSAQADKMNLSRRHNTANRVIISSLSQHTATRLCDSDSSSGPDFVSYSENLYCDMSLKQSFPLCSEAAQEECYDVDNLTLRSGALAKRGLERRHDSSLIWDSGN